MSQRWIVALVSINIGPPASAFAIVRADTRNEAAARAVRVADAWGADQRKKNIGVTGGDETTSRDGRELVGAPDKRAMLPHESKPLGSRDFRAVVAFALHPDQDPPFDPEGLPLRVGLWNLGIIYEDK